MAQPATPTPQDRAATRELAAAVVESVAADEPMAHGLRVAMTINSAIPAIDVYAKADVEMLVFTLCQEVTLQADDRDRAAERLLFCMRIYNGHRTGSRGPAGCLIDALEALRPDIAKPLREGTADAHDVYDMHFGESP